DAESAKKAGDRPRPVEVVFVKEGDRVRMVPVKRGISDDNYTEILEGIEEGQEVVCGGAKAISRDLEDGKKVRVGRPKSGKEGTDTERSGKQEGSSSAFGG
ncbi:MAG: efflux transporter periplasmic adaptor subunit, partial [Verrucomicrobiae bacterium]|nr:efflux transporter periplasmic adaptor subunit [Verrucomicrobiae bacterium]